MRSALASFLLGLFFCCAAAAGEKPNIILILADDLGWGDLGICRAKGGEVPAISTPHLNRLAEEGTQLRRHYSCAPVCAPARASLFGGVHQGHAETIRNNNFDAPLENSHTLASMLKAAGYATALIGKWGIGGGAESGGTPATAAAWPTRRGFDYFFGYHNHIAGHCHYPKEEPNRDPENGCNAIWDGDKVITSRLDGCYSTDLFTARAKKWIIDQQREDGARPFFLALTLTAPHARLAVPACPYPAGGGLHGGLQWLGIPGRMVNTARPESWDSFIDPPYRNAWEAYAQSRYPGAAGRKLAAARRHAAMVSRIDAAVGDLALLCRDLGIENKTFIVFASDNGPHNEPGSVAPMPGHPAPAQDPSFFRSYGNMDGIKRDVWEGGLRVPCIAYMPGCVAKGQVSHWPCQFQDWMATFAELAGIPRPMRCDGVSLLPTLQGRPGEQKPGVVYTEYAYEGGMPAYGDFAPNKRNRARGEQQALYFTPPGGAPLKAIRSDIRTGMEDFEIYDTLADSHEACNLAGQYADWQDRLRTMALYNRRAYDYARDASCGKRKNPCTGRRPYDSLPVPANEAASPLPGLNMRQVAATCPWTPEFDTLPGAAAAKKGVIADPAAELLPAGSITEFAGYLDVPQAGGPWHFYLTLDASPGSKAYARMHRFQLIDADSCYAPGSAATESSAANSVERNEADSGKAGIPLAPGLHEIRIVVAQSAAAPGRLKLEWSCGPKGKGIPRSPIPARAFMRPGE